MTRDPDLKRTRRRLLWLAPPLALAGCGITSQQSGTNQIQMAIYRPLCVEVTGASMAEGQTIETYPCIAGERRQEWSFVQVVGSTNYQVINVNSLMCMTVSYGSTATSTPVVQAPCYTPVQTSQQWNYMPAPAPNTGYNLVSAVSGQCLDIPEGATVGETQLQVFTCNPMTDPAQAFVLNAVAQGDVP